MTHIMLDLETWGKRPYCDIRSIGAVVFDPIAGIVALDFRDGTIPGARPNEGDSFYIATDNPLPEWYGGQFPDTNRKYPLTREPDTVKWWNDQDINARLNAFANPVDLKIALIRFGDWLTEITGNIAPEKPLRLWANGPQFDVSILEAAYHAVGLPVPWHYRAPRDFRTITDAARMTRDDYLTYGNAHNALDDAIAQAMTVCEAYKRLGLQS